MGKLFIPTLHTFAMGNTFTGSCGAFRFRVEPTVEKKGKEVVFENSSIHAEFWHGPFCYEKSEMEGERTFSMSAEGRDEMIAWLESNI